MEASVYKQIFEQFQASGSFSGIGKTGSGHIHTTWLVKTVEPNSPNYILQKVNNHVFPPVQEMMSNIQKVTAHIRSKRPDGAGYSVLNVIPDRSGKPYYLDASQVYWRLYEKVEPGLSYDIVPNEQVAAEAARAFGMFIADLEDFPAADLYAVIPDFHSVEKRFEQLEEAAVDDAAGRLAEVSEELAFAREQFGPLKEIPLQERAGTLPVRVTHNDTKLNNILFDAEDKASCVIDLDTVMPGLSLYDFGDLIRTACNTAEEDEADLQKVTFNRSVFKAIVYGFLQSTHQLLTEKEVALLPLGARYITYIMGIRFLADYIRGDTYYQISFPEQNLRRCRAQFQLIRHMLKHHEDCCRVVSEAFSEIKKGKTSVSDH